jgi:hypothetical protein
MHKVLALAAALALAGFGLVKGTWAVGGSDSSCYALMAQAFAQGRVQPSSELAPLAPWPDAQRTLAPAGFIPSPVKPDAASPVCAPGMSVLLAPLVAVGGREALFVLTPLAAGVLVWLASVLARHLAGGMAAGVAAVLVASSPIVLFQAVQPMNDIVTAALWVGAITVATGEWRHRSLVAGVISGVAILVRPNLAPLALVVAAMVARRAGADARRAGADGRRAGASAPATAFSIGALPGVAVLLLLNQSLYGSPFSTGYGDAGALFSLSYLGDNLSHYGRAVVSTQTAFPVLGLAAPFLLAGRERRLAWWLLAAATTVVAGYLFYRPYVEWWYLRFLITAVVLLLVLASAVAAHLAARARVGGVVAIGTVVLALFMVQTTGAREALDLQALEGRYRNTAAVVAARLPANAVLLTVWQSGSMRFHAGRESVLWDSLDPAWLERATGWLAAQGRQPFILLERREERDFRERFAAQGGIGALDWPPRFDINRQVRIYDPADRARFLAGEAYATENVRSEK